MAVAWGLAHRNLDGVTAIGIDEIAWQVSDSGLPGRCRLQEAALDRPGENAEDTAEVLQRVGEEPYG